MKKLETAEMSLTGVLKVIFETEEEEKEKDYTILDTYKKKIIENPIVDKILEMIAKANIDRLDFGLKKITKDYSHVVFTNETKYQNYKPDPDSKTKIIYSHTLLQYGYMVGLRWYQSCVIIWKREWPKTGSNSRKIPRSRQNSEKRSNEEKWQYRLIEETVLMSLYCILLAAKNAIVKATFELQSSLVCEKPSKIFGLLFQLTNQG